jgi:parallel beta-helix repeat protein
LLLAALSPAIPADAIGDEVTVAFFNPASARWQVDGLSDFYYGIGSDVPMACDWDGDGTETVGLYRGSSGFLYLRNTNNTGFADLDIYYGMREDKPICGDWDGDGVDTIGIFRPSEARFYLRNSNTLGFADVDFRFGWLEGIPLAGDWDGDGVDTVGVWRPADGRLLLATGAGPDIAHSTNIGARADRPVAADWDGDGRDTVALFEPATGVLKISDVGDDPGTVRLLPSDWLPVAARFGGNEQSPFRPGDPFAGSGEPPPGSVSVWPGEDIQAVVDDHPSGTTFYIRSGLHRLQQIQPKNGQTFIGEDGAIMSGARILNSWQQDGPYWYASGQTQAGKVHGPCQAAEPRCNHPEDLFVNGTRYRHVASKSEVGAGSWHFDYGGDRIYVGFDPAGNEIETSVAAYAFRGSADRVTIRNLVVEQYANPAQHGAIDTRRHNGDSGGSDWLIEGNTVRKNHGVGIKVSDGAAVVDNNVIYNGQLGISAVGAGALFEGNHVAWNGHLGYSPSWERGGSKFAGTTDLIVRANHVHDNVGPGLWSDVGAFGTLFEDNRVEDNSRMGIFYEISYRATIRNNHIEGNGFSHSAWLWGGGIVVANSPDVEVYGNTLVGNADGIAGIHQNRDSGPADYGPHELRNLSVHHNHVTMTDGRTGVAQDVGDKSIFTSKGNLFVDNTFVTDGGRRFEWDNRQLTYAGFTAYGQS